MSIFGWFRSKPAQVVVEAGAAEGAEPGALHLPPKPPVKHQTAADALDWWVKKHNGTYNIKRPPATPNGVVRVSVELPDGSVLVGSGETTAGAVAKVVAKLEAL